MRIRLTDYHVRFQGENRRGSGISFDREGGQFRAKVSLPPRAKSRCTPLALDV
jgi:hypothetical protein